MLVVQSIRAKKYEMEPEKDKPTEGTDAPTQQPAQTPASAPEDALSKSPDELAEEAAANGTEEAPEEPVKKVSGFKAFIKKVNIYLLLFILVLIIGGAVTVVSFLNSRKAPEEPTIATQQLTQEALKQLANSDATVGSSGQTLTVQGNAIFSGQVLVRSDLNVAGNIQLGGQLLAPNLTVSGNTNLNATQISGLQVSGDTALQGGLSAGSLSIAGTSTFNGAVTASQLTVSSLIISGNGSVQIPNHLAFTGPSPSRGAVDGGVLGGGGSASVGGSDTSGTINVNTGNNPTAGCFIRVNFAARFTSTPRVLVSPVGAGAGQMQYYVTREATGFNLCTANAAPANQSFNFDFFVAG